MHKAAQVEFCQAKDCLKKLVAFVFVGALEDLCDSDDSLEDFGESELINEELGNFLILKNVFENSNYIFIVFDIFEGLNLNGSFDNFQQVGNLIERIKQTVPSREHRLPRGIETKLHLRALS